MLSTYTHTAASVFSAKKQKRGKIKGGDSVLLTQTDDSKTPLKR